MYDFLVLGLIPGTDIQIGFWTWIIITVAVVVGFKRSKPFVIETVEKWWHQFDEDVESVPNEPMHASHLHLRGL